MMHIDIRIILPVLSIISFGSLIREVLKKQILRIKSSDSFLEQLLESLVFGTVFLVGPMLVIAWVAEKVGDSKSLERFVYVYLAVGLLYLIYKIYIWIRKKLPKIILAERKKLIQTLDILLIVIILFIFLFYIFQVLVYPLKGWDFLHFYLPSSFRLYATGQLSSINELSFIPQFKPPMNVLLFTYTFFITQSEMIQLVPLLFLAGTVYLVYSISKLIGLSRKTSLMASIAFLVTPLTFFLVYEFTYYQEMYIMFFATAAFYYFRKTIQEQNSKILSYNAILASITLGGCVMSKISGFLIPIIFLVALPSDKIGKVIRAIIVICFASQLIRKAFFDVFIGTGIIVALLAIYCLYTIFSSETLEFSWKRWIVIGLIFIFPLLVALFWGFHILSIPGVDDYLLSLFINPNFVTVRTSWAGITLPETTTYLENAHSATFISSSFSILIATMFAGTWLFFKIFGFIKSNKKYNDLILWTIFFFMFWLGLFSNSSIRYLTPIIVPITIIFVIGFESLVNYMNKRDGEERDGFFAFIFLAATAYLFLYPILPVETVFESFHLRWYYAHLRLGSLFGYIIIINLFTVFLLWKEKKLKLSYIHIYNKRINFRKVLSGFLIGIICVVPFAAQAVLIASVRFNLNEFQSTYSYDYRENFQELIDAINRLGYSDLEIVLTVNTPGLEYYASQPVIDLFMLDFISQTGIGNTSIPLYDENVTRSLEFFEEYDITMFVALNSSHDWFPAYLEYFYWNSFIFRFLHNNLYFNNRFSNDEFLLFTIKKFDPFIGPVDIIIANNDSKASLLSKAPLSAEVTEDILFVDSIVDLTAIDTNTFVDISFTTLYTTASNTTSNYIIENYQVEKPNVESFNQFHVLGLSNELFVNDTMQIHEIEITISYENYFGIPQTLIYTLHPASGPFLALSNNNGSWTYINDSGFVFE